MNAYSKSPEQAYEPAGVIDFNNILNALRLHLIPIAIAMGIVLGLTLISYFLAKPQYSATGRIGIERQADEVVANPADKTAPLTTDSSSVDTEVKQLSSPETLLRAVDTLGLARRPEFAGENPVSPAAARQTAAGVLARTISVARDGTSYAIGITYVSGDPAMTAAIVNATIDAYFARQEGLQVSQRDREIRLLRARLETLKAQVQRADTAVAGFRAATDLVDVQNSTTSAQQSLAVLGSQLADSQAAQAAATARSNAAAGRGGANPALASPVVQQLRSEESRLSAQRAALAERYGDRHPALEEVDRQLAEVKRQIALEIGRVRDNLSTDARVAQQRTSSIVGSMNREQGKLLQGNSASVRLGELERESDSAKVLYQGLLERYRQAVTRQGTEKTNAYVIARALQPQQPDSPDAKIYAGGGLIAALLAAAVVALGFQLMENGFATRKQVQRQLDLPVLASVPDLRTIEKDRVKSPNPTLASDHLISHPGSLFSESFRSIRTALKVGQDGQTARAIAIASALPNEGKTTTSFSLARSTALAGRRVVLVDCDLRRQASSRQMEGKVEFGLVEVLRGEATLEQALVVDSASGAFFLPQKLASEHHYDAISSSAMEALVARLKAEFDLVILDTAPILPIADSRAVCSMADTTLLAVRWRRTPVHAVEMALDQLALAGANVGGILLTIVDIRAQVRAGRGDEMQYYNSYKSYYS